MVAVSVHAEHVFQVLATNAIAQSSSMRIAVGNQHTHPSHDIKLYGGVYICVRCGATVVSKLIHLRNQCGQSTPALKYHLETYASGEAFKGSVGWLKQGYN